jgi:hypothetical protein
MAKTVCNTVAGAFESTTSNGTQPVIHTTALNSDGSKVKDPR